MLTHHCLLVCLSFLVTKTSTGYTEEDCLRLENHFWCPVERRCLPASVRCNYIQECLGAFDELDCPGRLARRNFSLAGPDDADNTGWAESNWKMKKWKNRTWQNLVIFRSPCIMIIKSSKLLTPVSAALKNGTTFSTFNCLIKFVSKLLSSSSFPEHERECPQLDPAKPFFK